MVNQCTNVTFLDEFTEWLPDQLAKYKNVVIMGDINFHLNNVEDPDVAIFRYPRCFRPQNSQQHSHTLAW